MSAPAPQPISGFRRRYAPTNIINNILTQCNNARIFRNYSANKLIGYEHIVGLHPGAAADENTRLHLFRLHRGAALH